MTEPLPDSEPPPSYGSSRWAPPSPEALATELPGYTVEKLLGQGGMGAVYKGVQTSLDRPVAIKILSDRVEHEDHNYAERFRNEARVMARLLHPAIVAVFDFGETPSGQLYFVMEYVDGTDVRRLIASQGRLSAEHALAIAAHVCDALSAAHDLGIVHRDIKPANVLITSQGQVKVADFGLAKIAEPGDPGLTKTGYTLGILDFMPPEALTLGVEVDARADLYAVGVMLYQMLTGELPRGAWKLPSEKVPGLDPRFDAIVEKAMQGEPDDRYQSGPDLREALDDILTVPLVQADGTESAAVPRQVVAKVSSQRSVAEKMPRRERSPSPSATRQGGSPARFIAGLVGAAIVLGALGWWAAYNHWRKEKSPPAPAIASASAPPKTQPAPTVASSKTPPATPGPTQPPVAKADPKPAAVPEVPQPTPPGSPAKTASPAPPPTDAPPAKSSTPESAKMAAIPEAKSPPSPTPSPSPAPPNLTPPPAVPEPATPSGPLPPLPAGLPEAVAERLREIDAQFQTAYDRDIGGGHAAALADLDGKYAAAVQRALDAASRAARLEEAAPLRGELKRLEAKEALPAADPEGTPESLRQLRGTYRSALAKLETERFAKAKPYHTRHDQLLDTYQQELTRGQRIEEALAVKTRRDALSALLAEETTALAATTPTARPPLGTTAPKKKAPEPPAAAKPTEAAIRAILDWVFACEGKATLQTNTGRVTARKAADLPQRSFDLVEIDSFSGAGLDAITDREFGLLTAATELEKISFDSGRTGVTTLAPLKNLQKLQTIGMQGNQGLAEEELAHLAGLDLLDLVTIRVRGTGEGFRHLRRLPSLSTLNVAGLNLTPAGAEVLAGFSGLAALRIEESLNPQNQASLAPIGQMRDLPELHLMNNVLTVEGFSHLTGLRNLRSLVLFGKSNFDAAGFLAMKASATTLSSLRLQGASITDEGFSHIVAAFPNLTYLHYEPIPPVNTAESLKALAEFKKLSNVDWGAQGLRDEDLRHFADMPQLARLGLRGGSVLTDAGLKTLESVKTLRELSVIGTKATPAGLSAFRKARPDVKLSP